MAKVKAEVVNEHHEREGVTLRDRLFANVENVLRLGSAFAPVSNWATSIPGSGWVMERTLGIASERTLPSFHRRTFRDRVQASESPSVAEADADHKVLLIADPYTNYSHPSVGMAALAVLEAANVHVRVPEDVSDNGRPAFSKSMLDHARETARENVAALTPWVQDGWDVVTVEPSDAVMYQLDYRDLLSGGDVDAVAEATFGVCEYLDVHGLDRVVEFDPPDESLVYHGHCQQKATRKDHHAVGVLRRAGYEVDALDSGCCGMAGSFGYETEHLSMSHAIRSVLTDQVDASPADELVAPGASCRSQLEDYDSPGEPPHPVEKLAAGL